jgi:hypothetical protein
VNVDVNTMKTRVANGLWMFVGCVVCEMVQKTCVHEP